MRKLLKTVGYCLRNPKQDTDLQGNSITVRPAFPYNTASATAPITAENWARYDGTVKDESWVPEVLEKFNDPFEVTITSLDHRSEGGRAYKVIDSENRLFDLREDQLMEAITDHGIAAGGKILGKFVWGICGSSTRLVLVDGDLYKEMQKAENHQKKTMVKISTKELVPGKVYVRHVSGMDEHCIFLGKVKLPNDSKYMHALVEVRCLQGDWQEHRTWHTKTWEEKYSKWSADRKLEDAPKVSITLLSTPNFYAEVATVDIAEFLNGEFNYYNGYGSNLVTDNYYAQHHQSFDQMVRNDPRYPRGYTLDERQKAQKFYNEMHQQEVAKFVKLLTWKKK